MKKNTPRSVTLERNTYETQIKLSLNLDGTGKSQLKTGVGFMDHMLQHFSKHGFVDLDLTCEGDLQVDDHHTIEDIGILLGTAIAHALGKKEGIRRYGQSLVPMDETLILCALDLSGRPYLNFDVHFTTERVGTMQTEMFEEFFRAVAVHSGMNLHIKQEYGKNNHHIAEGVFKAFGRAFDEAIRIDPRIEGVHSTKGIL